MRHPEDAATFEVSDGAPSDPVAAIADIAVNELGAWESIAAFADARGADRGAKTAGTGSAETLMPKEDYL